jgi:hypothetical protein
MPESTISPQSGTNEFGYSKTHTAVKLPVLTTQPKEWKKGIRSFLYFLIYGAADLGKLPINQCCGSVTFWYGSGSADIDH